MCKPVIFDGSHKALFGITICYMKHNEPLHDNQRTSFNKIDKRNARAC